MSLEKIKKYFEPNSILDIGANVGQIYNDIKNIFPNSYYYLIEGSESCFKVRSIFVFVSILFIQCINTCIFYAL